MAAHIAYVCSGVFPSTPSNKPKEASNARVNSHRYHMLGFSDSKKRHLCNAYSILALRMTEILEYALSQGVVGVNSGSQTASKSNNPSKGILGLFGFISNDDKRDTKQEVNNPESSVVPNYISSEEFSKVQSVLCPTKLRYSFLLSDFGYGAEALAYAESIKEIIKTSESKNIQKSNDQSKATNPPNSLFAKKFIQDLDEFIYRLKVNLGKVSSAELKNLNTCGTSLVDSNVISENESEVSSKNTWGISSIVNVMSSATLKEFVDGSSVPKIQENNVSAYHENDLVRPLNPNSHIPPSIRQVNPNLSMFNPHTTRDISINPKQENQREVSTFDTCGTFQNIISSQNNLSSHPNLPSIQKPIPNMNSQTVSDVDAKLAYNDKNRETKNISDTDKPTSPSKAVKNENPSGGLVTKVRKGLISWLYPEAHDADANLGKSMEAYFDKATGKWVFPGEEDNNNDPAIKPPPIASLSRESSSSAMSQIPSSNSLLHGGQSSGNLSGSDSYDPLAALMAPPSRGSSFSSSSNSEDPLNSLMAPPSRRIPSVPSMKSQPSFTAPPNINIWKPPSIIHNSSVGNINKLEPISDNNNSNDTLPTPEVHNSTNTCNGSLSLNQNDSFIADPNVAPSF